MLSDDVAVFHIVAADRKKPDVAFVSLYLSIGIFSDRLDSLQQRASPRCLCDKKGIHPKGPVMILQKFISNTLRRFHYTTYHHLFLWLAQYTMDRVIAECNTSEGLETFSVHDFLSNKKSDTIFVLGSGSSINRLTREQWQIISSNDSIGFNFWLLHDFIPNYYVLEPVGGEKAKILKHNLLYRSKDYRDVPFILKDAARLKETAFLENLPPFIKERLLVSRAINIPGTTMTEFSRSIDLLLKKEIPQIRRTGLLLKMRATLSYILFLAYSMGYKKIVLCGVDLNNSTYFFEENQNGYLERGLKIPANEHKMNLHRTIDPELGEVTVDQAVYALKQLVFEPQGIKLYIGSKASLLYPKLPYYFK